jgi:hypothetical protein
MINDQENYEPFIFQLLRQCLEEENDAFTAPDELSDKELYSTFFFIIVAMAFLALTVGPFSLLK